jgi:HK97 family phage major capsid protein
MKTRNKKRSRGLQTRKESGTEVDPVESLQERNALGLSFRNAVMDIRASDGDSPDVVSMSVSSEEPILCWAEFNGSYQRVYEILDHAKTSMDMSRCKDGLVILDRHYGDQVGLMDAAVKEKKLGGAIEFGCGDRSQEIYKDAAKKIRRNCSVGYRVNVEAYKLEGEKDGVPVVRATSWMPYEASFEPVPADITVGVGRSANQPKAEPVAPQPKKETRTMKPEDIAKAYELAARHGIKAEDVTPLIAREDGMEALRSMIIEKQTTDAESLRSQIKVLEEKKPDAPKERAEIAPIGGDKPTEDNLMRKYSVMNVLRSLGGERNLDLGFELEVSQECAKQRGKAATGIIIPHAALGTRDFTKAGTSSASIATDLLSGEFIDLLRSKTILAPLGVKFMTGLVGDVAIPKMSAGATGYWVTEGSDVTESQPTLGQVTGAPHTCGVCVDISRKLLRQSTPDAEAMVRDEIIARIARTIQIAVFAGTGASGQPSAITAASGINNPSVTEGAPTYAELLGFISDIMTDNAEADGMQFAMTAEVWAKLAATFIDSNSNAERVLDWKSKTCLGYGYQVSEDVGANSMFFGNWSTVNVGVWGNGVDLNADTASLSKSGGLRLVGLQDVDVMVRLGQALAYNSAVTA